LISTTSMKVILVYFAVALIILLNGYVFFSEVAYFLSILLLVPIYLWQAYYKDKKELSEEINGRDKGRVFLWILLLFTLALSVRIPSVLLFNMPYEKTPLIYLMILTIITIEKTDVSAFGFKTNNIGKALLHGLIFYVLLGGSALLIRHILVYVFINQPLFTSYSIILFLVVMPFHTLCVGISEEGLFRGYTQTHLQKFYTSRRAILIQATLFGIWHFVWNLNPFDPLGMTQYIGITFFIGLFFGYFYSKTRNLVPLVFAHGLWNSVQEGILTNEALINDLQTISMLNQILLWLLPYAISAILAFFFIKYFGKEI